MAEKTLARHVTIGGKTYGPGDDVPADMAEQITNPKAWVALDEAAAADENANREGGTESGQKLATTVTVGGKSYGPNDYVPDDVAQQITNPKAWEGGKVPSSAANSASSAEDKPGAPTPAPSGGQSVATPAEFSERDERPGRRTQVRQSRA